MNSRPPRYVVWFIVAGALHGALLFGTQHLLFRDAAYSVTTDETVDVDLVESAPAPTSVAEPPPIPPDPTPPAPEPKPEPTPVPAPPKPELVEPSPDAKPPTPKPNPKSAPKPHSATAPTKPSASTAPATAAASSNGAPTTGGANVRPAYLYNPHPPYPAESRAKGEQGLVLLMVVINAQGDVTSVTVRQSSGYPLLDSAARDGVRSWRFRPARLAGFPVPTTLEVPIRFRLGPP